MTEFPFAADEATADGAVTGQGNSNKKALIVAGGVVAALLLGAGGYFLTSGGSDSSQAASTRPAGKAVPKVVGKKATAPKPSVVVAAPKPVQLPAVFKEQLGRDPFKPLYVQPVVAAGPAGPTSATGTTGTTGTNGTTGTGTTANAPYSLKLTALTVGNGDQASTFSFLVSGASKTVLPAQRFGKYGELVVLAYTKNSAGKVTGAVVQVGDDQPGRIALGETISVL